MKWSQWAINSGPTSPAPATPPDSLPGNGSLIENPDSWRKIRGSAAMIDPDVRHPAADRAARPGKMRLGTPAAERRVTRITPLRAGPSYTSSRMMRKSRRFARFAVSTAWRDRALSAIFLRPAPKASSASFIQLRVSRRSKDVSAGSARRRQAPRISSFNARTSSSRVDAIARPHAVFLRFERTEGFAFGQRPPAGCSATEVRETEHGLRWLMES